MKKIYQIVLIGLLTLSLPSLSQGQDSKKGKEILNKTSKKYKSFKGLKADFKYTIEIPQQKFKDQQSGTAFLQGDKFKLDMKEQTIQCDGKKIYTYVKEDNSVTITKYDPKAMGINPKDIFFMYQKGYSYAYTGEEEGKSVVELTPNDKKKEVFKVKLYVEKSTNLIAKSKVYEKTGNIYTYEVSNFIPNPPTTPSTFSFDKKNFPKVIVTDLTAGK